MIIPGCSVTPRTDTAIRTVSRRTLICTGLVVIAAGPAGSAHAMEPWEALPPTPRLPPAQSSGTVAVNGAHIWRATFGAGDDVVMLHGGLAHSDYWGLQAAALAQRRRVLVIDSRGHGRSDNANGQPFSYRQMADDVIAIMDQLEIAKAAIVGWSDGAIIGLEMAMRFPNASIGSSPSPPITIPRVCGMLEKAPYSRPLSRVQRASIAHARQRLTDSPFYARASSGCGRRSRDIRKAHCGGS